MFRKMDCITCGKIFARKDNLKKHVASGKCYHVSKADNGFKCMDCPCTYAQNEKLQQHRAKQHPPGFARKELPGDTLQCAKCTIPFKSPHELAKHIVRCGRAKDVREKRDAPAVRENGADDGFTTISSALRGNVITYRHNFNGEQRDMIVELESAMREGAEFVESVAGSVKYNYCLAAIFCKAVDPDVNTMDDPAHFWSEQVI